MLILRRKTNESIVLEVNGISIIVTVTEIDNRGQVALGVEAPREVTAYRLNADGTDNSDRVYAKLRSSKPVGTR